MQKSVDRDRLVYFQTKLKFTAFPDPTVLRFHPISIKRKNQVLLSHPSVLGNPWLLYDCSKYRDGPCPLQRAGSLACWHLCPLPLFLAHGLANCPPWLCPSCPLLFLWPCPVGMWQPALTWWHYVIAWSEINCSIPAITDTSPRVLRPV